jgi:hypothetical protein
LASICRDTSQHIGMQQASKTSHGQGSIPWGSAIIPNRVYYMHLNTIYTFSCILYVFRYNIGKMWV